MRVKTPFSALGLLLGLSLFTIVAAAGDRAGLRVETETRPDRLTGPSRGDLEQFQFRQLKLYRQKIAAQESLSNTYDPAISESLTGMGKIQEKLGQYAEAVNSYRRAMHIQRVNNGIYSLSQEPMLRGLMTTYEAMDDVDSADLAYDQLQKLYARNYASNSPQLVALLKEKSDWHLNAYSQHPDKDGLRHLGDAYRLMVKALNAASADTPAGRVTVLPLWRNLAVANFLLADHGRRHPVGEREGFSFTTNTSSQSLQADPLSQDEVLVLNSYRGGRLALENIVLYQLDDPDSTLEERSSALADLGDWHLMFGRYQSAAQVYREAWNVAAGDTALREKLFHRPTAIPLGGHVFGIPEAVLEAPAAERIAPVADRIAPAAAPEETHSGYPPMNPFVVATLSINSRGVARDIEIVETYPEGDEALQTAGYRALKQTRFRPRLADGEMVTSDKLTYRLEVAP